MAGVIAAALPGDAIDDDDIVTVLFDNPDAVESVVFATGGGGAVAAAGLIEHHDGREAFIHLLAVKPELQHQGFGRELLRAVRSWASSMGATSVVAGTPGPYATGLWPGVDVHMTPALCLLEDEGYRPGGAVIALAYPARHRAAMPEGTRLQRAIADEAARDAAAFATEHLPDGAGAVMRAIEGGSCLVAYGEGPSSVAVVGFACHSVNRLGWLGPIWVEPAARRRGIGRALLGAVAEDVMVAGLDKVVVPVDQPISFFAKAAGASAWRAFRTLRLALGGEGRGERGEVVRAGL